MTSEKDDRAFITRFAPSPTGRLHLGHAYSALLAHDAAKAAGGRFILRIEDIDQGRCKDRFIDGIFEDLNWLGISWETPVRRQSRHFDDYEAAITSLASKGLLYPCICSRKDIREEVARAASAPHGPEGLLYPGLCKARDRTEIEHAMEGGAPFALRLDMEKALASLPADTQLSFHDMDDGEQTAHPASFGDVVIARKDMATSYHLSVTVDDALQGITHIIRGEDLRHATHIHRLLQALLDLPTPIYQHHPLLADEKGERLAKRDRSQSLQTLRKAGRTPDDIREEIARRLSLTDLKKRPEPHR